MKTNVKALITRGMTVLFLLYSCFYMYDFYKCLSGFIANGFREPLVMLPMILAFFLPVLCFLFFVYDFYVKPIHWLVKTVYSVFVILYAIVELVLIFMNIELYASNNALGVYDALPSIILHFPYDMIILLICIILWQVFNLFCATQKGSGIRVLVDSLKERGALKIHLLEYITLCVFAIVIFVFTGSAIYAVFSSFKNAFYDFRFIFTVLWVMLIPMADLLLVTLKPEKMNIKKRAKLFTLCAGILANILFGIGFWILELTYPDFLIHIGKPLFLIAFSISIPIEPAVIFGIMAFGTVIMSVRAVLVAVKEK